MSAPLFFSDIPQERKWPYDDRYMGKCKICGGVFAGPKRAPSCWQCASAWMRDWWLGKHDEAGLKTGGEG